MKRLVYRNGEIIFRQQDKSECMYDIVSGSVGIFDRYGTDQEIKISELKKNQTFGEMGMIEYRPRSATAVALEDGTVLTEIEEADLDAYFRDKPEKLLELMRMLSKRIRETTGKYMDVCRTICEHEETDPSDEDKTQQIRQQMEIYAAYYNTMLPL